MTTPTFVRRKKRVTFLLSQKSQSYTPRAKHDLRALVHCAGGEATMPGKFPRLQSMRLEEVQALHTRFLRVWVSQHYRKDEEDAQAENDRRDEAELKKLTRVGMYREWQKRRKKH